MFLYEPDNYENINTIKGFVGVKVALCMHTKYFACKQICTKCFINIQNSCAHTNLLRKKQGLLVKTQTQPVFYIYSVFLRHIAFFKVLYYLPRNHF